MYKNNLKKFQQEFANASGMLASRFSLSPTVGQIYGLLYLSQQPVSLDEMVKKLGISKGSASTNVRTLESWNAVKKVWVNNSRKDYYEANSDTLKIIIGRLKEGLKSRLQGVEDIINKSESKLKRLVNSSGKNNSSAEFYFKKIGRIKEMYQIAMNFIDLLDLNIFNSGKNQ